MLCQLRAEKVEGIKAYWKESEKRKKSEKDGL